MRKLSFLVTGEKASNSKIGTHLASQRTRRALPFERIGHRLSLVYAVHPGA